MDATSQPALSATRGVPQPGDHYILKKLSRDLLPWMIAGRHLDKQWFVGVAVFDGYLRDLMAALAALGIGAPFLAATSDKLPSGTTPVDVLQKGLHGGWFIVGVIALVSLAFLRIIVNRQSVVSRALFANDIVQTMKVLTKQMFEALQKRDPMPQITQIQKSVDDAVANAIKNGTWPYDVLPPRVAIAVELDSMISEIRERFMAFWAPAPAEEQL